MNKRSVLLYVLAGACCAVLGPPLRAAEPAEVVTPAMKEIDLDAFLHGMLAVTLPIKMAIPAEYEYTALRNTSRFSAYWMRPDAARKAQRSGAMPTDTGWMSAEVSGSVVFDAPTGTFVGLDLSSPTIAKGGFKVLESQVVTANEHPVVFVELLHAATNKPLYMMYVATLAGDNVVLISYRAPRHNRLVGDAVWAALKKRVSDQ
ncbi:MAG: hypothetical protein KGL57_06660 [Burkholderiales bacterium]|nr:hypothetical protein [Burkholderiales bacterium]